MGSAKLVRSDNKVKNLWAQSTFTCIENAQFIATALKTCEDLTPITSKIPWRSMDYFYFHFQHATFNNTFMFTIIDNNVMVISELL